MEEPGCDINSMSNGHLATASAIFTKHGKKNDKKRITSASTVIESNDMKEKKVDSVTAPTAFKKPRPRRAMILTGLPTPTLPPRPIFPPELERYQVQGYGSNGLPQYNSQMLTYLANLRRDYEKQLKDYDHLKTLLQEDKYYAATEVDVLDALDDDPFTLDSFENLMRIHASKGKDFIMARVTTQDPNDEMKHYYSYYGAHQINKVLFRTQPEKGLLHRMRARNPLNNMLVVGDVHYYSISAQDVNAVNALPTVHSSSSSISSHSSRMSRCSKLGVQAIDSRSASAHLSPILSNDVPWSSGLGLPLSIKRADEDGVHEERVTGPSQSGKPSRLYRIIGSDDRDICSNTSIHINNPKSVRAVDPASPFSDTTERLLPHSHQQAQSPLFHSLMGSSTIQSRSNTMTKVSSDKCSLSSTSCMNSHRCRSTTTDTSTDSINQKDPNRNSNCYSNNNICDIECNTRGSIGGGDEKIESATYKFRYLASDDDFLLRSAVRQTFKANALESCDATLFTVSNNASQEYTSHGGDYAPMSLQQQQRALNPPLQSRSSSRERISPTQDQQEEGESSLETSAPGRSATELAQNGSARTLLDTRETILSAVEFDNSSSLNDNHTRADISQILPSLPASSIASSLLSLSGSALSSSAVPSLHTGISSELDGRERGHVDSGYVSSASIFQVEAAANNVGAFSSTSPTSYYDLEGGPVHHRQRRRQGLNVKKILRVLSRLFSKGS